MEGLVVALFQAAIATGRHARGFCLGEFANEASPAVRAPRAMAPFVAENGCSPHRTRIARVGAPDQAASPGEPHRPIEVSRDQPTPIARVRKVE
jgi:hypothetical protein